MELVSFCPIKNLQNMNWSANFGTVLDNQQAAEILSEGNNEFVVFRPPWAGVQQTINNLVCAFRVLHLTLRGFQPVFQLPVSSPPPKFRSTPIFFLVKADPTESA